MDIQVMEDDLVPDFKEVSSTIEKINSSLFESSLIEDFTTATSNEMASTFFLKELLQRQKESHKKIQALQKSVQEKDFQPAAMVRTTPRKLFKEDFEVLNWESEQSDDVSLQEFMCKHKDDADSQNDNSGGDDSQGEIDDDDICSDEDDLTTLGSYREVLVNISKARQNSSCSDLCGGKTSGDSGRSTIIKSESETDSLSKALRKHSSGGAHVGEAEDELSLCIDMMAGRMKELELEKERVKLDVIVALRKRFESLMTSGGGVKSPLNGVEYSPNRKFEKFNDSVLYEVTLSEVDKVRESEREKTVKLQEKHDKIIEKLTRDVERLTGEKSEIAEDLSNSYKKLSRMEEAREKFSRVEGRVSYLESLLQTIERENDKLKIDMQKGEDDINTSRLDNRLLEERLIDAQRKFETAAAAEAKLKSAYDTDHQQFIGERKEMKDEVSSLQTQLQNVTLEKEKVVNSKETDLSIIKHLEDKLLRQGTLLDTISLDSTKYFEMNLKLEKKASEYKQKIKKSVYGIEHTLEENRRLHEEKETVETEKAALKKSLMESKRRESELQFHMRKLTGEWAQKEKDWKLQLEACYDRRIVNGVNDSFAVLDKNKWNRSLGNLITSSTRNEPTNHVTTPKPSNFERSNAHCTLTNNNHELSPKRMLFTESESGFEGSPVRETNLLPKQQRPPWSHVKKQQHVSFMDQTAMIPQELAMPIQPLTSTMKASIPSSLVTRNTKQFDMTPATKYRTDDTRMFLKEMSYKLEHTEAALKLADHNNSHTPPPSFSYDSSVESLQHRLLGLRDEVLNL